MPASRIVTTLAVCFGLAGCTSGQSEALESPAARIIAERQDNFKAIKQANDAMKKETETVTPSVTVFQTNAMTLLDHVELIDSQFPEGSGPEAGVETEALPAIWENRPAFAQAASRMTVAAQQFVTVTDSGDVEAISAGLLALGETCRACHRQFRKQT